MLIKSCSNGIGHPVRYCGKRQVEAKHFFLQRLVDYMLYTVGRYTQFTFSIMKP